MVIGIGGACRRGELWQLKITDLQDLGSALIVKLNDTKTKRPRSFTITDSFYDIYKKYAALRPPNLPETRFFLNFQNGKCTRQAVGINKFGKMPEQIASFLKLPDPKLYTGHSFRRTSATMLVNAGADLLTLKRHGGWLSDTVAEGYIDDSMHTKMNIANKIMQSVNPSPSNSSSPTISNETIHLSSQISSLPSTSTAANHVVSLTENLSKVDTPGITIQNCSNFTVNYHYK